MKSWKNIFNFSINKLIFVFVFGMLTLILLFVCGVSYANAEFLSIEENYSGTDDFYCNEYEHQNDNLDCYCFGENYALNENYSDILCNDELVPSVFVKDDNKEVISSEGFPEKYDPRNDENFLLPCHSQSYGHCAFFATIAACEGSALAKGLVTKENSDFSEFQLLNSAYTNHRIKDPLNMLKAKSEYSYPVPFPITKNNTNKTSNNDSDVIHCENFIADRWFNKNLFGITNSLFILASWYGPVSEDLVPYSLVNKSNIATKDQLYSNNPDDWKDFTMYDIQKYRDDINTGKFPVLGCNNYDELNQKIIDKAENAISADYAFKNDVVHLQNAEYINFYNSDGTRNFDDIKNAIIKHKALAFNYTEKKDFYNGQYHSVYDPTTSVYDTNHAIDVVGWDDNFDKNHFGKDASSPVPEHNGAWLIRNSWGPKNREGGYFWLSYDNHTMIKGLSCAVAIDVESPDNYDNNYQYDGTDSASKISSLKYGDQFSNVFTAQHEEEDLKAISFAPSGNNTSWDLQIYKLDNINDYLPKWDDYLPPNMSGTDAIQKLNETYPTSGIPLLVDDSNNPQPKSINIKYGGYHTEKLDVPIRLHEGDRYAIVLTNKSEGKASIYCAITDLEYPLKRHVEYCPLISFMKKANNDSWKDLASDSKIIRIKAFTDDVNSD